jgi:hypothetical protein
MLIKGFGKSKIICLAAIAIAALVYLYWYGAVRHLEEANTDLGRTDQSAYMRFAKRIYEAMHGGESYYSDGARMPLYPFLQSFLYEPTLSDEAYFVRVKYSSILLSLLMLVGVSLVLGRYFPWPLAVNLILITAFTVFIFKAAYFHPELMFYFFNFCAFLLMCKMLSSPSWKLGILTGVVLGAAHLAKASVLLGLELFIMLSLVKVAYLLHLKLVDKTSASLTLKSSRRVLLHQVLSVVLVIMSFLATVYPYISWSKEKYGKYFYNVSTDFYMWYDSWSEVKQGTRAHGDREGWPDMPPEEIPSAGKYLREHTVQQIIGRVLNGLSALNSDCRDSYGYYKYALIYFAFFLLGVMLNFRHNLKLAAQYPFVLLFFLFYFVAYLMGYAWFTAITEGNRLILAQFLPFMFSISYVICAQPATYLPIRPKGIRIRLLDALNGLVFLILIFDIYFIMTGRIVTMYGGE